MSAPLARELVVARARSIRLVLGLGAALAGCGAEVVVHGVNEKEANYIVEVLAGSDIDAGKVTNAGGREVVYDIAVGSASRIDAIRVLNQHDLPRRRDRGYHDVFAGTGLIPTSSEEKAKRLAALEGEIERQLKLVDGLLDVQVQLVLPDESALRTTREQEPPTTASVTVKYLPDANGARPIGTPEVQALVAAGVEKLTPENVVVLMRPGGAVMRAVAPPQLPWPWNAKDPRSARVALAAVLSLIVLLVAALVLSQWQVRTVRGRLIRLQTEITKARRKVTDALPPAA